MTAAVQVRPMRADDVQALLRVQLECYPAAMNETAEVLLARWQACPDTAWVAVDARGDVGAYLVAYRSCRGKVSALGAAFAHHPEADVLYLHDLAIGRALRGQGVAGLLVSTARRAASQWGLHGLALVSVNDTVAFWQGLGLQPQDVDEAGVQALGTYEGRAVYMTNSGPTEPDGRASA